MRRVVAVLGLTVFAGTIGCSSSASTDPTTVPGTLGPGKWGSESALLEITGADSANARFDFCAEGRTAAPILLTPDGQFNVPGTYIRNIGPSIQARSARYVGLWRPSSLTLTVVLGDPIGPNESNIVGPFDLVPGHTGPPPRPCPIVH